MSLPRFFILPVALLAATAGYIALNPGAGPVAQVAGVPTPTEAHARLVAPTATPAPADELPDGLSGKLTYRTGRDEVTVQLPEAGELDRRPVQFGPHALTSADGMWTADRDCATPAGGARSCSLVLTATDGRVRNLQLDIDLQWSRAVQWSPAGHQLAMLVSGEHGSRLAILNEPYAGSGAASSQRGIGLESANVSAFAWTNDIMRADGHEVGGIIAARGDGDGYALVQIDADSGEERVLATLRELPNFFYPSPDHSMVAFTGSSVDGWHLFLYDNRHRDEVRDLGPMGSDGPDGKPVVQSTPDVKIPMYIAWSPDGKTLAFGGGLEPPYVMTIIDIASGDMHRTQFPDGYPGEIAWSPDGTRLAVSTYNIPRTHHESWVVDPATGVARDVLSGCVIVWSPDSRFLAIHGEKEPGIAIADVETLQHAQLTHTAGDTPLRWER
jgi:Tol biopolymer transport system component